MSLAVRDGISCETGNVRMHNFQFMSTIYEHNFLKSQDVMEEGDDDNRIREAGGTG